MIESAEDENGQLSRGLADFSRRWDLNKIVRLEWGRGEFIQFSAIQNPFVSRRPTRNAGEHVTLHRAMLCACGRGTGH